MSENERARPAGASRRAVVGGVLGLGAGAPLVAACGSGSGGGTGGTGGTGGSGGNGGGTSGGGGTSAGAIGTTSEVPVGGGKIFSAQQVVVTQPTKGDFKAFSAICTHQGCLVSAIQGKDIDCTCHGSAFSITDGSVVNGPATQPLQPLKVTVKGDEISVA